LSGPYPTWLSGNKYIISFMYIYSWWPEAFPVPDKSADNIVHLILEEIYLKCGCPLQILTDNGTQNVNKAVDETLKELYIDHITSYYSPQGNRKVDRFYRTIHSLWTRK
jgi:transposase InsO family protein